MLCKKFREFALEIINCKEKEMIPLNNEENESYEKQKFATFGKTNSVQIKMIKIHLNYKFRDHCHYTGKFSGAAHSICNFRYKIPKEIPAVAHNETYDHHFIIKQLAKEFDGQF